MSMKVKENVADATGANNEHRAMNEIMRDQSEQGIVTDMVKEKHKVMKRDKNWAFRVRVTGMNNKKV